MKVPDSIADIRRKTLRYILFQYKRIRAEGGERCDPEVLNLTEEQVLAVEKYFLKKNKQDIDNFPQSWDLGIDELNVMANRDEKYWLFGIDRFVVVERPIEEFLTMDDNNKLVKQQIRWPDDSGFGKRKLAERGFAEKLEDMPGAYRVDYQRILEGVGTRNSWLEDQ